MRTTVLIFAALIGLASSPAEAGPKKPFTATAVQSAPNAATQSGQIYVSDQGTRFEFSEQGRDIVQIVMTEQRIMRVLFPADKVYMETQAPADTPLMTEDDTVPCPKVNGMTCAKLGVDKFGTMDVERWSQTFKGNDAKSTLWWDESRKMIVRQEYPDGSIMQLSLGGTVDYYGRKTEQWNVSYVAGQVQGQGQAQGQVRKGMRLIDTDLGIIVKDQAPTGVVRELQNVKVVEVSADWFKVPAGFKRIEQPTTPAQAPAMAPQR